MLIKKAFSLFIVRPIVLVLAEVSLKGKENLPTKGSAILVANHNSHFYGSKNTTFVLYESQWHQVSLL